MEVKSKTYLSDSTIWSLLLEVEDMDDESLVDEVAHISFLQSDKVDLVIYNFFTKIGNLTEEDRDELIWFYVMANIEEGDEKW